MKTRIKEISAAHTWQIRHQVMWPNKLLDYVKLENDGQGKHYGLFVGQKLVSVVSLFIKEKSAQFRKFATVKEEQGKGLGTTLLDFIFKESALQNMETVWCNARKDKADFYKRFGMEETKKEFLKGEIEYVVMEKKLKHQ